MVQRVKSALPHFRAALPDDIDITFEFDQSYYVTNALSALTIEGLLGALLTGLLILIALGSFRSAIVVLMTIPLALLSALVALWATGQSVNLITLGGLTLAIGILVDESVIAIENIHSHLGRGRPVARALFVPLALAVGFAMIASYFLASSFVPISRNVVQPPARRNRDREANMVRSGA